MTYIDIVSGFLGAGKTTFIKKLIGGERTVVIENEFGEIGIDGDVLRSSGLEMVEITSGCICCLMRKEMASALDRVLSELSPERIIIEPTGISMLSEVVRIVSGRDFRGRCSVRSLAVVVDCSSFLEQVEDFGEFFSDQISHATLLALSKTAGVPEETMQKTVLELRLLNPSAPICMDDWRDMPREDIERMLERSARAELREDERGHRHGPSAGRFSSFSALVPDEITYDDLVRRIRATASGEHGRVVRGKGFARADGRPLSFDLVRDELSFAPAESEIRPRVCFIGEGLDLASMGMIWR